MGDTYTVKLGSITKPVNEIEPNLFIRVTTPTLKLHSIDKWLIFLIQGILFTVIFGFVVADFVKNEAREYTSTVHSVAFITGCIFLFLSLTQDIIVRLIPIPEVKKEDRYTVDAQVAYRENLLHGWFLYVVFISYYIVVFLELVTPAFLIAFVACMIEEVRALSYLFWFYEYGSLSTSYFILNGTVTNENRKGFLFAFWALVFIHLLTGIDLIFASLIFTNWLSPS